METVNVIFLYLYVRIALVKDKVDKYLDGSIARGFWRRK